MGVEYRIATKKDLPEMVNLMSDLGYRTNVKKLTAALELIRSQSGEVFVADDGKHIIGCINAIIDVRLAEGSTGEIVSLVIDKQHRGKGVGKGLLKYAEQWLTTKTGMVRIRANTLRTNAHRFYLDKGYNEIKEQKIFMKKL